MFGCFAEDMKPLSPQMLVLQWCLGSTAVCFCQFSEPLAEAGPILFAKKSICSVWACVLEIDARERSIMKVSSH